MVYLWAGISISKYEKIYFKLKSYICPHSYFNMYVRSSYGWVLQKKTKILDQKWHLPLWKEQHWSRGAVQLFILPKHESQCSQGEQNHLVQSSAVNTLSHFLIENFKKNCRRQVAKPWSTFGQAYKFQNMKKYISN